MTQVPVQPTSDADVAARLDFAAGALGAAGHEVTDPFVLELCERVARQQITGDQAVAEIRRRHRQG